MVDSNKTVLFIIRAFIFLIFLFFIVSVNFVCFDQFLPINSKTNLWLYSGLLPLYISRLFVEPHYTSHKLVLINSILLFVTLIALSNEINNNAYILIFSFVLFVMILINSWVLATDRNEYSESDTKRLLKDFVLTIGAGKVLFSISFLSFILAFNSVNNYVWLMLLSWAFIMLINVNKLYEIIYDTHFNKTNKILGKIISFQSNKVFLVEKFKGVEQVSLGNIVQYRDSSLRKSNIKIGVIFDQYIFHNKNCLKILQLDEVENTSEFLSNVIYKVENQNYDNLVSGLVGFIIENSTIDIIRFEYFPKGEKLLEGDIIKLSVDQKEILYQIINSYTANEKFFDKNEVGFIEVEAVQLGIFDINSQAFTRYDWVPDINSLVKKYKDSTTSRESPPKGKIGVIPGTNISVTLNLEDHFNHHIAILGVTGSGKSYLARNIVESIGNDNSCKIICIDTTGYWKEYEGWNKIENIESINVESYFVFEPQRSDQDWDDNTKKFLDDIYSYAQDEKYSFIVILEEAQTLIPEKRSTNIKNILENFALQGRKYGIGLIVISQRSASISKTVLTQCNTIICFQAFDSGTHSVVEQYVNSNILSSLSNLRKHHAIVAGRDLTSNVSLIADTCIKNKDDTIE